MKIGRTEFGEHIKKWTWYKFRTTFEKNVTMKRDISRYGYNLESAYEFVTNKKVPKKDVPKVPAKSEEDKD